VCGIVVECVPPTVAEQITNLLDVPVIGIGAGPACDGQILVMNDLLGLSFQSPPKFVKRYATLADTMRTALMTYKEDVTRGTFPADEHCYK